jgi:hypothetical protein
MIRKIRNEFAHDLDMDRQFGEEERKPKASLVEEYNAVAFSCIVGLDAYRENLSYLRARIQKPVFIAALFEESMTENKSRLHTVIAKHR